MLKTKREKDTHHMRNLFCFGPFEFYRTQRVVLVCAPMLDLSITTCLKMTLALACCATLNHISYLCRFTMILNAKMWRELARKLNCMCCFVFMGLSCGASDMTSFVSTPLFVRREMWGHVGRMTGSHVPMMCSFCDFTILVTLCV